MTTRTACMHAHGVHQDPTNPRTWLCDHCGMVAVVDEWRAAWTPPRPLTLVDGAWPLWAHPFTTTTERRTPCTAERLAELVEFYPTAVAS